MIELLRLYRKVLGVIPRSASRFLNLYSIALGVLSVIDSLALGLLAIIITPLVAGTSITFPIIGVVQGEGLMILLGVLSAIIVLKSFGAVVLLWWATRRFAHYELLVGNRLFDAYLNAPWTYRLTKNSSDLVRIADSGIANSIAGFLLPIATLLGEALTFLTILIVLLVAQPVVAISAMLYLSLIAVFLFLFLAKHAKIAAEAGFKYSLRVARLLTEMVTALKEITLSGKSEEIADVVRTDRRYAAQARSNAYFLSGSPRYVLEAAVIGGFVLVGVIGYVLGGPLEAFSAIALFSVAGFRMVPSITRFQAVMTQSMLTSPQVRAVVTDIAESENLQQTQRSETSSELSSDPRSIEFDQVRFSYPAAPNEAIRGVTIDIPLGQKVAFVGASGSGKTSMVDLMLGLIEPTSGAITIDGMPIKEVLSSWRRRIGYLPQEVALFDGTIAQNVALSWGDGDIDEERVRESLKKAQLLDFIEEKPGGISNNIGERGLSLSGGQRQRLGIARALYNKPSVLIMDEGTSALDNKTEEEISRALDALNSEMSLIVVAHRLSTIRDADVIFYMHAGQVVGSGTFDELIEHFPDFAEQAKLSGLSH